MALPATLAHTTWTEARWHDDDRAAAGDHKSLHYTKTPARRVNSLNMAETGAKGGANDNHLKVDTRTPPDLTPDVELDEVVDPLSSLPALASALDSAYDDVPGFINSLLSDYVPPALPSPAPQQPPNLPPIEKQLNELMTRLSLLNQDTSSALEQSISDISRTVPRLTYDLQFMRESAVSLQSSLRRVQDKAARQQLGNDSEEARTQRHLDKLTHLDKLKTRMEAARDILAEAESWSTLESEITTFIAEREWTKAGERLAEASKSLVVFQSTEGEYESKRSLLVSLQNELETALSAALRDAIAQVDTATTAQFHEIFRMMEREHEFRNYYFAARRAPILEAWTNVVLLDAGSEGAGEGAEEGTEPVKFSSFLPKFYETIIQTLNSERTQIPLVFQTDSAANILSSFFETTLDALSPSFHNRLSAVADHYGPEALPEVIRAFTATEELGVQIQGLMDKLAFNTQGGHVSGASLSQSPSTATNTPVSPSMRSRRSTNPNRMSMSHRFSRSVSFLEAAPASPTAWETTIYEPFLDLQSSYPALEKRYLRHLLKHDPALTRPANRDNPARTLNERAAVVFGFAEDAIGRCVAFTHGYGTRGLIDALNDLVRAFLENNGDILDSAKRVSNGTGDGKDDLGLEGLDYSTEDWGAFQVALHVLEACRGIRDKLSQFETKLYQALTDVAPRLIISAADPASFTLKDTTLGALTLLQQSTLNSVELHSLIGSLPGKEPPAVELTKARDAVSNFTRSAQVFLQSIILSPLRSQLDTYPSLSVWEKPDKEKKRGDLHVPTFSLSPTDTMARVAEGLLNLLRVFEEYAADESLAFSIETLPFVDVDSLRELLAKPSDVLDPQAEKEEPTLGAEAVLSTWVSSLALSLLSSLTKTTLHKIPALSNSGSAQLASDLAYLSNAVRALDVEWEDLEKWREAAEATPEEWREKVGNDRKGPWGTVGRLRGFTKQ
ncbi:hypothetical protein A1Q2_07651 [Trichosporon asahii var. asahii CBS 8904]|uniref:Conserved oligomeric Golgi complex subunit 7 n=1 Tax=Trichosporon asahii var. asahii (strain CBS 8904) TaxID=1220162 RepID=K1VBE0_TRIAC|nr:hypothetical protein A1Q2_07651 [Trichosporon asahii var. asahii CBS 8904]